MTATTITIATILADILRAAPGSVPVDELAEQVSRRIGYEVGPCSVLTAGRRLREHGIPVCSHRVTCLTYQEASSDRG